MVRSGGEPTQTTGFIKGRFENTAALIKGLTAKIWWMRAAFKQFLFTLELVKSCRLNAYSLLFYRLYNGNTVGQQFGPKCCRGDKIGCGISLDSDDGQVTVFFTKNGKKVCALSSTLAFNLCRFLSFQLQQFRLWMCMQVGSVETAASLDTLYPAVGMHSLGEEVLLDLNAEWGTEEDDGQMIVDSHEDDWSCLHDVRMTGTVSPVELKQVKPRVFSLFHSLPSSLSVMTDPRCFSLTQVLIVMRLQRNRPWAWASNLYMTLTFN